ncbi:motA/TolQ/ExbB proton channel family domain-containing protein [Ditylenchus destructor]|nr:motA/TolQ/ExbB proton channel family domain-containing protein [Ditylenchus destructor]
MRRPVPRGDAAATSRRNDFHVCHHRLGACPGLHLRRLHRARRQHQRRAACLAVRNDHHLRRGHRRDAGDQSAQGHEGHDEGPGRLLQGQQIHQGPLHGAAGAALRHPAEGPQGGPDVHRKGRRGSAQLAALPEIPDGGQRPPCRRIHHRLSAHDGLGQPERPRDRIADGREIDTHHHEAFLAVIALQRLAGGLPAFGIVAAVLGVVNTMGSVGQPPAVLGGMIGSALVGTFLGILLAYAFAEPLAGALEAKVDEAGKELQCIKTTLLASMQGYAPQVAIEFGRKVLYSTERPTFAELEGHVKKSDRSDIPWPVTPRNSAHHHQARQEGRPCRPWRRLEDRLRRLHHGDDGVFPGDVAAGLDHRGRQEGHRRLLRLSAEGGDVWRLGLGRRVAHHQGRRSGPDAPDRSGQGGRRGIPRKTINLKALKEEQRRAERVRLQQLKDKVEKIIADNPKLAALGGQIRLDMTREGLRIQIVDENNRPMFDSGSAVVKPYMRELLQELGGVLSEVPNRLTLEGHTDAQPFSAGERGYSNWNCRRTVPMPRDASWWRAVCRMPGCFACKVWRRASCSLRKTPMPRSIAASASS